MNTDIFTTFQRAISIVISLGPSVSLGVSVLVCVPQSMFLISAKPFLEKGEIPNDSKTRFLFAIQILSVLVLTSWAMGVLINRTAHAWFAVTKEGKKTSVPGIKFASFQKNQAHAFLWPMVGYTSTSTLFVLAMVGFAKYWDEGLSVSLALDAIMLVLGNLLAWVCILYFYACMVLAGPIIVLERKGIMNAMKASYYLANNEYIRWQILTVIISFMIMGVLLDLAFQLLLGGLFGSTKSFIVSCIHFNALTLILLPLYSRYVDLLFSPFSCSFLVSTITLILLLFFTT